MVPASPAPHYPGAHQNTQATPASQCNQLQQLFPSSSLETRVSRQLWQTKRREHSTLLPRRKTRKSAAKPCTASQTHSRRLYRSHASTMGVIQVPRVLQLWLAKPTQKRQSSTHLLRTRARRQAPRTNRLVTLPTSIIYFPPGYIRCVAREKRRLTRKLGVNRDRPASSARRAARPSAGRAAAMRSSRRVVSLLRSTWQAEQEAVSTASCVASQALQQGRVVDGALRLAGVSIGRAFENMTCSEHWLDRVSCRCACG